MKKLAPLLLAGLLLVSPAPSSSQSAAPTAPAQPSDQIDLQKYRPGQDFITLNFNNIEIPALIKVMSELTRKNFIIDERVTGKVTLMTPTRISPAEAYQVFLSALEIKGFTAVEDGKVIRIIATAAARQSGLKVIPDGDMRGEGFVTKLIRMAYVNPQDISRTLTPLISKDGNLIAYPATNSLIITDSVHNIRKIESLIRALDVPAPEGKGKINVYPLRHANAEDIAKVMSSLVSRLPVPPAGGAQPAGPSTILEGAVTITSDKATNSLIIVASPIDYETVKDVLKKLDIRRRQVYVEAAIIEMGLSKSRELGFEFQTMSGIDNNKITAVGGTNFGGIVPATVQGPAAFANFNGLAVGAVKGTFTYNNMTFLNIGALLRALQTDANVNVLSTPNILTTDNQKAEIMVGENVPFKTGQSQSAATGGASILTTIERKDVGINLKITPQITSDDSVRLEIYQEISNVVESAATSADGPTTSKRSASTTVVIKDRETMVIGGLIRDNVTSTASKVPLLGDIPILGWFFKYKTTKIEKTNLMIFITPYIIKNEQDAADITHRKSESQEDFRKDQRFEKKGVEPVPEPPAEKAKTDGSGADAAALPVSSALPSEKPAAPAEGAR